MSSLESRRVPRAVALSSAAFARASQSFCMTASGDREPTIHTFPSRVGVNLPDALFSPISARV